MTQNKNVPNIPQKISVKNLYKIFGDVDKKVINLLERGLDKNDIIKATGSIVGVCNANFSINKGEIFVIMGLSGSGKSTLVRLLNRLIEPTHGEIYFDNVDITAMSKQELIQFRREQINMVFQSFALMPHMNVVDNVAFGLELSGIASGERKRRALEALNQVGLDTFALNYPDELSGGMQQRVGLARALVCNPSVMLMDEAFSALDPLIRAEMQDELLKLQETDRRTIVFITHDLDEAMRIGDRIAIMEGGRIIQTGTPNEILQNPANEYVASFFRGVDTTDVLRAKDMVTNSRITFIQDGHLKLETTLNRLNQTSSSYGYVLDEEGKLGGVVTKSSLILAIAENPEQGIAKALNPTIETVHEETSIRDLIGTVSAGAYGVPVINQSKKYVGCITKTSLLTILNQRLNKKHG
ncbi:glycine betaine/L-proline ABC transporter ATP-binding protein ProV [Burkholderiales bacterium]|nr:glycine betaine/L-proline ABC transporter ATP-binding protein ProV [Burkholderiales bacterium]